LSPRPWAAGRHEPMRPDERCRRTRRAPAAPATRDAAAPPNDVAGVHLLPVRRCSPLRDSTRAVVTGFCHCAFPVMRLWRRPPQDGPQRHRPAALSNAGQRRWCTTYTPGVLVLRQFAMALLVRVSPKLAPQRCRAGSGRREIFGHVVGARPVRAIEERRGPRTCGAAVPHACHSTTRRATWPIRSNRPVIRMKCPIRPRDGPGHSRVSSSSTRSTSSWALVPRVSLATFHFADRKARYDVSVAADRVGLDGGRRSDRRRNYDDIDPAVNRRPSPRT
jgi:hypothetical protein